MTERTVCYLWGKYDSHVILLYSWNKCLSFNGCGELCNVIEIPCSLRELNEQVKGYLLKLTFTLEEELFLEKFKILFFDLNQYMLSFFFGWFIAQGLKPFLDFDETEDLVKLNKLPIDIVVLYTKNSVDN